MSSDGVPDRGEPNEGIDPDETPEFEEGRYLYCLVRTESDAALETTGIDDETVSVVAADGIGAVVHDCDEIYDAADLGRVRRWLVRHQLVVDRAGERFGTPIPFQFDTILRGDDEDVREWLREERGTLSEALSGLADHWEYRVEVSETEPIDDETLIERDEELRDLRDRIDDAGEGEAFLLEKQYDQRVATLRRARRDRVSEDLQGRLDDVAREVHALDRTASVSLAEDDGGDDDGETLCRLSLLAHEDAEDDVGSVLDDVAANPGLEVRFTGPWPPYTFAPTLGDPDRSADGAQP